MSADGSGDLDLMPEQAVQIVLRPVASSLPLGFLAFGAGSVLLTALELNWVPPADGRQLMVMVLAFVVPLEVLAGIFAFLARDHGAATGLTLLGAAWAATAITVASGPPGDSVRPRGPAGHPGGVRWRGPAGWFTRPGGGYPTGRDERSPFPCATPLISPRSAQAAK